MIYLQSKEITNLTKHMDKISAGILIALVATIMTISWIGAVRFDEVLGITQDK